LGTLLLWRHYFFNNVSKEGTFKNKKPAFLRGKKGGEKMAQWKCQVKRCQNLLPWEDSGKYRLRYLREEQVKALPAEIREVYESLAGKNLCRNCAKLARRAGLMVITVAQAKQWAQKQATRQLLDLISDDEAKGLKDLKAGLEGETVPLQVVK
jgi:hypothetical protein